jgi:ribosome maturation factor RimP
MIKKNIVGTVTELISPVAEEMEIILWDVEFVKEGSKKILRITIDSEEGIDINLCERFHRTIDPMLDEADPIDESYYLEVTSPGIEREIKTDAHIAMCEGERVEIKLYAPKNGSKTFSGTLVGLNDAGKVVIDVNGEGVEFERNEIAKMHTVFDF